MGTAAPGRHSTRYAVRHPVVIAVSLAAVGWAVSGCGAGFNAQTNQQYQGAEGINNRDGLVYVLNALVVTDEQGNGTFVGTLIDQSSTPDALVSVTATDSQGSAVKTTKLSSPIALKSQQAVQLQTDAVVRLNGKAVVAGDILTAIFTFQNASPVEIGIPVVVGGSGTIYSGIPIGSST